MTTSSKWKYAFGSITIGLIVGGTIYAIVKARQAEKAEDEAISLDEAKEIVARTKNSTDEIHFTTEIEDFQEHQEEISIQKVMINSILVNVDEEDDEDEEDMDDIYHYVADDIEGPEIPTIEPLKDFFYYEEGIDPKEDKTLRYEPDSVEAKHQFIRMELADWEVNHDVYRIMLQLFEFPLIPTTEGDEILRTQIIDYKVQFFGFNSRWNKEVSFADVILHYARSAEFNCGESVAYWVEYFLDFSDFQWDSTSNQIDELILSLNSHTYFNEERQTFGLFGLSRDSMDQAIKIANRNIDRSVSYEIEFNEFLKSTI